MQIPWSTVYMFRPEGGGGAGAATTSEAETMIIPITVNNICGLAGWLDDGHHSIESE